jgi:two-component system sensor histidine kinase TctE
MFVIGVATLYVSAFAYGQTVADRFYDRLLAGSAESIAERLVEGPWGIEVDIPYAAFDLLNAAPDDKIFYRVFDEHGRTITGYSDLPRDPKLIQRPTNPYRADPTFFTADYRSEKVRFVTMRRPSPSLGGRSSSDILWVQIGQTRGAHEALVEDLVARALAPILLMSIAAMLLTWFGLGRALRPLQRIGDELAGRGPEDLAPIASPVPAEVAGLVTALDAFMARLRASVDALGDFVAHAAHQLRTPLAAIRAQAQVADPENPEDAQRSLVAIERNAVKLSRLVNQMLSEATMAHRADLFRPVPFDLLDTLREAVQDVTAPPDDTVCRVETEVQEAPVCGDALMIGEAFRNVLHNAARHGGGEIAACLRRDGTLYVVEVADRGPGIEESRKHLVFDRFASGSMRSGGAGLGLTIARLAIERHGGTIGLHDRPGGGLIVRIALPAGDGTCIG